VRVHEQEEGWMPFVKEYMEIYDKRWMLVKEVAEVVAVEFKG
jgi:hypothetical protein